MIMFCGFATRDFTFDKMEDDLDIPGENKHNDFMNVTLLYTKGNF